MQKEEPCISVEEALKKGFKMVDQPSVLAAVVATGIAFFLCYLTDFTDWAFLVLPVVGTGTGMLCRNFLAPKWRIWAFQRVRNVHELQERAIAAKLMRGPHEMFGDTEFWNAADRETWSVLQSRFEVADVYHFEDDPRVPAEIIIRNSVRKHTIPLLLGGLLLLTGIAFLTHYRDYSALFFGSGFTFLGLCLGAGQLRKVRDKEPKIILSNEGIQTATTPFYSWNQIDDERMCTYEGKVSTYLLMYNYPGGDEKVVLNDLEMDPDFLQQVLRVYRARHLHKTLSSQGRSSAGPDKI